MSVGLARAVTFAVALAGLTLAAPGCSRKKSTTEAARASASAAATASVPAPIASGVPLDPETVTANVNPDRKPAYTGPTGSVEGRIVATGDAPAELPDVLRKIPDSCREARAVYGKVFREGPERGVADVLVAATGYDAYIPARESVKRLVAKGCSFGTRLVALTFGQRLEVVSGDHEAYVPDLLGEPGGLAQIVATPGGEAASMMYPSRVGRFVLIDNIKLFMTAEVFVLKYATFDVTGTDGRYRIGGLPPGEVKLSILLGPIGHVEERKVRIEANKTATADFRVPFDRAAYERALAAKDRVDAGTGDAGPDAAAPATARPGAPVPR